MSDFNERNDGGRQGAASGRSGPNIALIAAGLLAAIIAVFFLRNGDRTELDFLFLNWNTTVRWSIFVSILLGVLLDRLISIFWRRRSKKNS